MTWHTRSKIPSLTARNLSVPLHCIGDPHPQVRCWRNIKVLKLISWIACYRWIDRLMDWPNAWAKMANEYMYLDHEHGRYLFLLYLNYSMYLDLEIHVSGSWTWNLQFCIYHYQINRHIKIKSIQVPCIVIMNTEPTIFYLSKLVCTLKRPEHTGRQLRMTWQSRSKIPLPATLNLSVPLHRIGDPHPQVRCWRNIKVLELSN